MPAANQGLGWAPVTRIFPLVFTVALRAEITQGKPGGGTPRTIFRFTVLAVGPAPTALATGMTVRSKEGARRAGNTEEGEHIRSSEVLS